MRAVLITSAIGEIVLMAPATRGCGYGLFSSPCLRWAPCLGYVGYGWHACYAATGGFVCRCFWSLLVEVSQTPHKG